MNPKALKVNRENLRRLCWQKRFKGVTGLARAIGKHRTSIHRAVNTPSGFPRTYQLVLKALR
jgi:DNA-binding phage protein